MYITSLFHVYFMLHCTQNQVVMVIFDAKLNVLSRKIKPTFGCNNAVSRQGLLSTNLLRLLESANDLPNPRQNGLAEPMPLWARVLCRTYAVVARVLVAQLMLLCGSAHQGGCPGKGGRDDEVPNKIW